MPELRGVLNDLPVGVPPLFEQEDSATTELAVYLASEVFPDCEYSSLNREQKAYCRNMARTIVRNVASMVLEDWIE